MRLRSVDLPQPDAPSRHTNSPGAISSDTSSRTTGPVPKRLETPPIRIVQEWTIAKTTGRRIESPEVAALSVEITDQLRKEIRRNAA